MTDQAGDAPYTLPDGTRVYRIESRSSFELNLEDVSSNGSIEIYPHVEADGLLFIQFRKRRVVVAAGPFIGFIPLSPGVMIEVIPKLPVSNLARVLDGASRSLAALPEGDRVYLVGRLASGSVLEFLALNLVTSIQDVLAGGFFKQYDVKSALTGTPKGRISLTGTQRAWARGQRHLVQTSYFEQSSDTPANRLLKEALISVLRQLKPINESRRRLIRSANLALNSFPSIVGRLTDLDKMTVSGDISGSRLPEQKSYYYKALGVALMILDDRGVALQDFGNSIKLSSYIVNFETLFEDYARSVLIVDKPDQCSVRDGNKEGKRYLFDARKGQMAQPDIVVRDECGRIVIAEVKYKTKPNRDDINQAVTYAVCYRTSKAVLVHQSSNKSGGGLYRLGTINGIDLDGYGFDLSHADIEAEESKFRSAIFGLLPAALERKAA